MSSPVSVFQTLAQDTTVGNRREFRERCNVEGQPYSAGAIFENATYSSDGNVAVTIALPGITRAFAVDHVTIGCNRNCRVQLWLYDTGLGGNGIGLEQFIITPNAPVILPSSAIIRPALQAANAGGNGTVKIRNMYDATLTGVNLTAWATGWSLTDDLDFYAPKTMLWIGDSITGAGTGPTVKTNQFDWRIRKFYRDAGIRVRMVNMSVSGTTSAFHESRRAMGAYTIPADLICYSASANDAVQGLSASAYQGNVAAAIAWKQSHYPNAKMIVFGTTPMENNTSETNAATLRTNAAAAVTAAADPKVLYCNLGTAFDRTLGTTVYAASDSAGSRIHPNDTGHSGIWSVVSAFLTANVPTI